MFCSMTAYGKAHKQTGAGGFLIEIHSVNRKNLEVAMHLPKEFLGFDMKLRKELSKKIKRGSITVRVTKEDHIGKTGVVLPDIQSLRSLQDACYQKARALGYDLDEALPFHVLLKYAMIGCNQCALPLEEELQDQLMDGFKTALAKCISMREKEGALLVQDIDFRLSNVEKQLDLIVDKIEVAPKKFREKLERCLREVHTLENGNSERIAREIVIFAEKVDATEEIIRLRSHIEQFRRLLASQQRHSGRELNFLVQEMNREVNTVASKSQDLEITKATLEIKADQEKMREQIQNIE